MKSGIGRLKACSLVHGHALDSDDISAYLTDRLKSCFMDMFVFFYVSKARAACVGWNQHWEFQSYKAGASSVLGKGMLSQIRLGAWYNLMYDERIRAVLRVLYFAFTKVRMLSATSFISFKQIAWVIRSNREKHKMWETLCRVLQLLECVLRILYSPYMT